MLLCLQRALRGGTCKAEAEPGGPDLPRAQGGQRARRRKQSQMNSSSFTEEGPAQIQLWRLACKKMLQNLNASRYLFTMHGKN